MGSRKPRTNGALRAIQIVECLVERGEAATAYQIAKILKAPLSTIYDSIALLEGLDILAKRDDSGKVFLGPRLHFYGLAFARSLEADEIHRREAESLSRITGENVQICVRDGECMVVSFMIEGAGQFRVSSRPGSRSPLNWSASGRLLLAYLPPEEQATLFERAAPSPTGRAVTDPTALERVCREAREKGYCIQIAESDFAVACIAAPVVNPKGVCVAAVSLVVPESTAENRGRELAGLAIASAQNIRKHLGWSESPPEKYEADAPLRA